jgi:hypothetical protein
MSRSTILASGLVLTLLACATTNEKVDPNTPETCFTVDNREGGGPAGRVYLISAANERIRLGEVPMGRELQRCIRRSGFGGEWHLIVQRASSDRIDPALNETQARPVESQPFYLTPGDHVSWNVHLNWLRYLERGGGG